MPWQATRVGQLIREIWSQRPQYPALQTFFSSFLKRMFSSSLRLVFQDSWKNGERFHYNLDSSTGLTWRSSGKSSKYFSLSLDLLVFQPWVSFSLAKEEYIMELRSPVHPYCLSSFLGVFVNGACSFLACALVLGNNTWSDRLGFASTTIKPRWSSAAESPTKKGHRTN